MFPPDGFLASWFHGGRQLALRAGARARLGLRAAGTIIACSVVAGCSTPGPGHAYLYSPALGSTIRDVDPFSGAELAGVPAYVAVDEPVLGMAYDPFTDHFFIRLFPGNRVRVVDRPASAIKREFVAPSLPLGGHDLAVRSRDRHLFFTDPNGPGLIETNANGELQRYLRLEGLEVPPRGVAYDPVDQALLVLANEHADRVLRFDMDGRALGAVELGAMVEGASLGFDADAREFFASLADGTAIGVFDSQGRLLRRLPRPASGRETFIDIGPRSLLRLF